MALSVNVLMKKVGVEKCRSITPSNRALKNAPVMLSSIVTEIPNNIRGRSENCSKGLNRTFFIKLVSFEGF